MTLIANIVKSILYCVLGMFFGMIGLAVLYAATTTTGATQIVVIIISGSFLILALYFFLKPIIDIFRKK